MILKLSNGYQKIEEITHFISETCISSMVTNISMNEQKNSKSKPRGQVIKWGIIRGLMFNSYKLNWT